MTFRDQARAGAVLVGLLIAGPAAAQTITCTTPGIIDGDTINCDGQRVRLWGIDAPERATPQGPPATRALDRLTRGKRLVCEAPPSGQLTDRYRRAVRQCWANGEDIAAQMVRDGFAKDMPRYSGGYYAGVGE